MKTNIPFQSTSIRPLFRDFEEAGVGPALKRGVALLDVHCNSRLLRIPPWLTDLDFGNALFHFDVWSVGALVREFRSLETRLRQEASDQYGTTWSVAVGDETIPAIPDWAVCAEDVQIRMVLALGRLALGSLVEAVFALEDLRCSARPESPSEGLSSNKMSRMYGDALLVAVWTSAHAEYVSYIQSGVEEPPLPGIHLFPNSLSEYDFGGLLSMRSCPRMCSTTALPLLQVFQRALNAGSRGWKSILESALQESVATRQIIVNAVLVALIGMHTMLPPSERAPWNDRMRCHRTLQHVLADGSAKSKLIETATATKEAVRRMIATFLTASPALVDGLSGTNQTVLAMRCPPIEMPSKGVVELSKALASTGLEIVEQINDHPDSYVTLLNREFWSDSQATVRDKTWIGKSTCNVNKTPCVSVMSDIWSSCFRVNFLAFWAHCMSHQRRASRLDSVQFRALHGLNSATKLANALPANQQLHAQRQALTHVSAGLLTVNETVVLLGIKPPSTPIKNVNDAMKFLLSVGPEAAGRIFVFARAAWVSEEIVLVDLGKQTFDLQSSAIFRRLRRTNHKPGASLDELPIQATHLHVCIECRRVASAHLCEPGKPGQTFTELGTSGSMLCTECDGVEKGQTHILCSKRTPPALKTALATEETIMQAEIEQAEINLGAVEEIFKEWAPGSAGGSGGSGGSGGAEAMGGGLAARVRRDAKTALQQRERVYTCGEQKMLKIPIVGRAIRVFGGWYAICSLCGSMLRVLPMHRHGAEICCCKCDAQMLGLPPPSVKEEKNPVCRFCNAVDFQRKNTRWKMVKAPLDVGGDNSTLPPALRQVFYCPKHYKPWITAAHRVLQTRIILSHIAHNAKPIYNTAVQRTAEELGFEGSTTNQKKRARTSGRSKSDGPHEEED
jgi:hypothetical protein